jgi:hypothetical protein
MPFRLLEVSTAGFYDWLDRQAGVDHGLHEVRGVGTQGYYWKCPTDHD